MDKEFIETSFLSLVKRVLDQWANPLLDAELQPRLLDLKRSENASGYSSEIEVDFLGRSGIVDVLEFHVFLDGRQVTSISEAEKWLQEGLKDVLRRQGMRRTSE
jgi:hypothetical protein